MHTEREISEYLFATGTEVRVPKTQLLVHGTAWNIELTLCHHTDFSQMPLGRTTSKPLIVRSQGRNTEAPPQHEVKCLEGRWF